MFNSLVQIAFYQIILFFTYKRDGKYDLDFKNPKSDKSKWITPDKLTEIYEGFIKEFPIVSIEDPFEQDDWKAWTTITEKLPKTQVYKLYY